MKKILLFAFLISANYSCLLAQLVPNGSFENWNNRHYYDEPNFGATTNLATYLLVNNGNVEKTTDAFAGNFAAKLTTVSTPNDTIPGIIFIGSPNTNSLSGGIAAAVRPNSLQVQAKFNISTNDTASVLVAFKKLGVIVGSARINFIGNQPTYQLYSTPITWADSTTIPDSLIGIFNSSVLGNGIAIPGSYIFIDDVGFSGAVGAPSTGFESWLSVESLEADNWSSLNFALINQPPSVTRSTDAYDGVFALQIKNVISTYFDTIGIVSNGYFNGNLFSGGMAVNQNPMAVTGYYKYSPIGNDTALVGAYLTKFDAIFGINVRVDSSLVLLPATSTYLPFYLPFQYNGWPIADTLNIVFAAGNFATDSSFIGIGSVLTVDKIEVLYSPVSIKDFEFQTAQHVYPNPATSILNIRNLEGNATQNFILYDAKGSLVFESNFNNRIGEISQLDISSIPNGFYMYQIIDGQKTIKGKLTIQH